MGANRTSPLNVSVIKEKIESGQVRVKAGRKTAQKTSKAQNRNNAFVEEVFQALQHFTASGADVIHSTMIRDELGLNKETGRDREGRQ